MIIDKIWAASDNGLYLLDENYNVAQRFDPDAADSVHRKPFSQLLHGYEDGNGFFWLAGRMGLYAGTGEPGR